ncbi:MAG: hypothetical protein AB7V32_10880 [Candidatus Berkiella sp.]
MSHKDEPAMENPSQMLSFYVHHLEQLDRLLAVIELLKTENRQLRQMVLKQNPQRKLPEKSPTTHAKPRITCWTFNEKA